MGYADSMNLGYLRAFYEVARAGSVTEGARRLRVSQPAVSKSIHLLEDELGARLLERLPRGIRLTAEGGVAFERASRIFSEADLLKEDVGRSAPVLKGAWSLGASDTLAMHVFPPVLAALKNAHPGLRISVFAGTSTQIKEEMLRDRCDLGVFFTPLKRDEPFEATACFETEFWIVAAPALFTPRVLKQGLRALKPLPRIESRHMDYSAGFPAHFHSHALGLTSQPFLEVNSHELKKSLALQGCGYSLLIRETVAEEVRQGRLVRMPTPEPLRAPVFSVLRRGRSLGRASREFLSVLGETRAPGARKAGAGRKQSSASR
jgi:DNA-binding transcriptional LysR family regulator